MKKIELKMDDKETRLELEILNSIKTMDSNLKSMDENIKNVLSIISKNKKRN